MMIPPLCIRFGGVLRIDVPPRGPTSRESAKLRSVHDVAGSRVPGYLFPTTAGSVAASARRSGPERGASLHDQVGYFRSPTSVRDKCCFYGRIGWKTDQFMNESFCDKYRQPAGSILRNGSGFDWKIRA